MAINQSQKGGIQMPLVKIIRHGQITLPAKFRQKLKLEEGDYLEAELEGDRIVLKPQVILDREEAIEKLHHLMDEVGKRHEDIPEEEIERDVLEAIQAVRQKEYARKRRQAKDKSRP